MANMADEAQKVEILLQKKLLHIGKISNSQPDREICDCGRIIAKARRKALPGVVNCVDCQSKKESRLY